eukprot:8337538-Pyramimonas_sp.AAC.1
MEKKATPDSPATARASSVFPHPGGPACVQANQRLSGAGVLAGADPGLCLWRDHPGLLWVVSSTAKTVLSNVEEMVAPFST